MKHAVAGRKLNRSKKHRSALFTNLMVGLFEHGSIVTTQAKAKAIKNQAEKLISDAKSAKVATRRSLAQVFGKRAVANLLVDRIAKSQTRSSGYTRIVILGERRGDNALLVRLELVDYQAPEKAVKKSKRTAKQAVKPIKHTQPAARFSAPAKITPKISKPALTSITKQPAKTTKKV
jgi:large subunit ribosomal protein L17